MLYMVEMNMPHHERLTEWHEWYRHHLQRLIAIPGILTAQRFQAEAPTPSPFLAVYSIVDADVLTSPGYRSKAGPTSTGDWQPMMTNWYRNIADGLGELPEVSHDGWLALMDRTAEAAPALPADYVRLRPVGLDCSFLERGLTTGSADDMPPQSREEAGWRVRVFRPIGGRLTAGN